MNDPAAIDARPPGVCECGGILAYTTAKVHDLKEAREELAKLGIALHLTAEDLPIRLQFLRCINSPGLAPVLPPRPEGCQRRGVKITNKGGLLYQSGRKV